MSSRIQSQNTGEYWPHAAFAPVTFNAWRFPTSSAAPILFQFSKPSALPIPRRQASRPARIVFLSATRAAAYHFAAILKNLIPACVLLRKVGIKSAVSVVFFIALEKAERWLRPVD
jgi:hypothetical protein